MELLQDKKVRSDSLTGVTDVNLYRGRYKAVIYFQKKKYNLRTYETLEEAAAVRKKAEQCLYGEFLDVYNSWKQRADSDPQWGEENPFSVQVIRSENGDFRLAARPEMD